MATTFISPALPGRRRRRHSDQFKSGVIGACRQPGVSIAGVALANGLNANLLRRWVVEAEQGSAKSAVQIKSSKSQTVSVTQTGASFVPVKVDSHTPDIRIELKRNGTTVNVSWPSSAAAECGAWLREVLR